MKTLKFKSLWPLVTVGLLLVLIISGCANNEDISPCLEGKEYGFWNGLWHGIIAPINLIASIWREDVSVFAPNNSGFWYAFGFVIGSGGWGFFGGRGSRRRRKKEE